jgi:Hint module
VGIFDTTGFNTVYTPSFYAYTGSLPTTLANLFGSSGNPTGIGNPNSGPFYSGLDPISAFPGIYDYNPIGAMEPGLGRFVAGTPVLMADASEKPIKSIQVGETVLAWNEETKRSFVTKVVSALHHDEKMQTLFDIELEDGRKLTVNNDHPMYVVEDHDFVFTRDLASRLAKGEPITLQNYRNQPVKIANLQIRTQSCHVYNLHVEGQGKKGHTYYASGILVHNEGAGNILK